MTLFAAMAWRVIARVLVTVWVAQLLISCTTTQLTVRPDWQQQQQQAQLLQQWQLTAVVRGVRKASVPQSQDQLAGERFDGDVAWHVAAHHSTLYFLDPFGGVRGEYSIDATAPDKTYLELDGQPPLYGYQIDEFMVRRLGVTQADLSRLRAWVVGAPYDVQDADIIRNNHNQLMEIKEQGTRVQYLDFTVQGAYTVPRTVVLDNHIVNMTIQINWEHLGDI